MSHQSPKNLAGLDIPQAHDFVLTAGEEVLAVGRIGHFVNPTAEVIEYADLFFLDQVIDLSQPVLTAGGRVPAVRGKDGGGRPRFLLEAVLFLASVRVPEPYRTIVAAGKDELAVGGEGDAPDFLGMAAQAVKLLATYWLMARRRQIPQREITLVVP